MVKLKPPPPEPERVAIPMPTELISRIDEFRWRERVPSRAAAIRTLIEMGLRQAERHERNPRPQSKDPPS